MFLANNSNGVEDWRSGKVATHLFSTSSAAFVHIITRSVGIDPHPEPLLFESKNHGRSLGSSR